MQIRFLLVVALLCASTGWGQSKKFKPGFNLMSKEQDIQLGLEAAQQVEKQMVILRDAAMQDYITRIGKTLATEAQDQWPFTFKVVHEDSINAFALPGGPMFIHSGLIKAADNEAQLAGVMAHEMAHVILRHGTSNVSKAQLIQLPAMLAGSMVGNGSMLGMLSQLGIQLGAGSVLMKMSRGAERDADLLGANMMHRAGYNPIEMARFFEKLQGSKDKPSVMAKIAGAFTSDHPDPGDRVKSVEKEITTMPKSPGYTAAAGNFASVKSKVEKLPPAPKPVQAQAQAGPAPAAPTADMTPSGQFKSYQGAGFTIDYPSNWQVYGDPQSPSATMAPKQGIVQGANGQANVAYGVMIAQAPPSGQRIDLRKDTQTLLQQFSQGNPSMKSEGQPQSGKVDGKNALLTRVSNESAFKGTREIDVILTVDRGDSLFYAVFIAPESEMSKVENVFKQMLNSIRFSN